MKELFIYCVSQSAHIRFTCEEYLQCKQRLLQASADNQHIPLSVVESVHGVRAEKCVAKEVPHAHAKAMA